MINEYMKKSYEQLVEQVYDGQQTFSKAEGFEIFAAAFLLALKSTMDKNTHERLSQVTIAQVIANGFLANPN